MDKQILEIIKTDPPVHGWDEELEQIMTGYDENLPQDKIIFTGSSSIKLWESLSEDMKPLEALNHGFGGSRLYDSIYFAKKLVYDFNPKAVVVFSGTNDLNANEDSKSAEDTFVLAKKLLSDYRENIGETPIYYISVNRCNSRDSVAAEVDKFNDMTEEYINTLDNVKFIRTSHLFYDENGLPDDGYFMEDRLHLNQSGYKIWNDKIKPVLLKDLL